MDFLLTILKMVAVQSTTHSPIFTAGSRVYALPEFLDVEDIEASWTYRSISLHEIYNINNICTPHFVVCAFVFFRIDMCGFYFMVIKLNILWNTVYISVWTVIVFSTFSWYQNRNLTPKRDSRELLCFLLLIKFLIMAKKFQS